MVASSWARSRDVWVDPSAPDAVDASTWCFVRVGDRQYPTLTPVAKRCTEYGQVFTRRGGEPEPFGGLVRHWALAEQLDRGSDAAVASVVRGLVLLSSEDRTGLAVTGSWRLAALVINQYGCAAVEWAQGVECAIATGSDPVVARRRWAVFAALNADRQDRDVTADELETWDGHAIASGVDAVVLAVRAGYVASEVTPEQLADTATLQVAAALNATGEWS